MAPALRSTALRCLALAALALAAALLANTLADPSRRLAWAGAVAPMPVLPPRSDQPALVTVRPDPPALQTPKSTSPSRPAPPSKPTVAASRPAEPASPQTPAAASPIREISGPEAWVAFQAKAPFLDARRSAEFIEGHIAGAWSAPVWESDLDDRLIAFKAARRPGPEDSIVIYCSGGDCRDSHLLAAKLFNEGYDHLLIYRDGFPDWLAQKHPVEKGQP
jgi:rhodanese-related sulfurtransferase